MQYSAINVRIKYHFQSTMKIQDSDGSCSEKRKFTVLFYSWKKIKTLLLWKILFSCTNVYVDTSHIKAEVLDKYTNQTLEALGSHRCNGVMGSNAISDLQHPIQGRWETTGQSPDHHIIWNLENLASSWRSLVSSLYGRIKTWRVRWW